MAAQVLVPGAMLGQVLVGHPGYALSVAYRPHAANGACANLVFSSGAPRSGAQNTTLNLHDGWTVTSFGPAAGASVLDNADALALLIGGILCSVRARPAGGRARRRPLVDAGNDTGADGGRGKGPRGKGRQAETERRAPRRGTARCPPRRPVRARDRAAQPRAARSTAPSAWSPGRDATRGCWRARCSSTSTSCNEVNEKLGLAAGNQLLKIVGERLRGRGAHGRYGRPARRRRVRRAGRIGGPRGAPGLARPADDRGAAQTDRARRLRARASC